AGDISARSADIELKNNAIRWEETTLARVTPGKSTLHPRIELDAGIAHLAEGTRGQLVTALEDWLAEQFQSLNPLRVLEVASQSEKGGPELRALLIRLVESGGMMDREDSGL